MTTKRSGMSRQEAGRKGAEARWGKKPAASKRSTSARSAKKSISTKSASYSNAQKSTPKNGRAIQVKSRSSISKPNGRTRNESEFKNNHPSYYGEYDQRRVYSVWENEIDANDYGTRRNQERGQEEEYYQPYPRYEKRAADQRGRGFEEENDDDEDENDDGEEFFTHKNSNYFQNQRYERKETSPRFQRSFVEDDEDDEEEEGDEDVQSFSKSRFCRHCLSPLPHHRPRRASADARWGSDSIKNRKHSQNGPINQASEGPRNNFQNGSKSHERNYIQYGHRNEALTGQKSYAQAGQRKPASNKKPSRSSF